MTSIAEPRAAAAPSHRWAGYIGHCRDRLATVGPYRVHGHLTRVSGLVMEAAGLQLPVGASCTVQLPGAHQVEAEVVGFAGERLFLMPIDEAHGLTPGALVMPKEYRHPAPGMHGRTIALRRNSDRGRLAPVGERLLGRVLDGSGHPLDELGPLHAEHWLPLYSRPINPLSRAPIDSVLDVGVRAINALMTIGRGQRMGLFSGSGVGKSVLLGMMARYTTADVTVVGLIGERGREVKEFIEQILGPAGMARSVVIAAPADTSPLRRIQAAAYTTAVAEYFRDRGKNVLLIMDSLTRFAMAQREIALAVGEPPATKGYPPSVFAKLPQLVERTGNGAPGSGSITAFYTVLTEGDDHNDPIADAARAILDGHIVLSRSLADAGHYPAINVESSISRVMTTLAGPLQIALLRQFKGMYSRYERNRDLVSVGAYVAGSDPLLDRAIEMFPRLEAFLRQDMHEPTDYAASIAALRGLFPEIPGAVPPA